MFVPILRGARRVTGETAGRKTGLNSVTAGAEQNKRQDWTFQGFAPEFDAHVREQLPWYGMATESVALIARHYIPRRGLVYDLGASTGNVGRALSPTLTERNARLVALDEVPDMVKAYNGPGRAVMADVARYPYKPFDVAVCFLVLMFLPVPARRRLLATLREKVKPGGAIIVVDKEESPGGYPATVLSRLTWDCKLRQGAEPGAVMRKELSLSGVQRPLYRGELGPDAVEVFRFGDFAGWLIEG